MASSAADFSLDTTGGFETPQFLVDAANKTVLAYPVVSFVLLVVLTLVVLFFVFKSMTDHFNPTQNLRDQDSDQYGLGKRENLEPEKPKDRSGSLFASMSQGASLPTSSAAVMSSQQLACAGRKPLTDDDAWSWTYGVARENMAPQKPQTDNDFSKVLAGH